LAQGPVENHNLGSKRRGFSLWGPITKKLKGTQVKRVSKREGKSTEQRPYLVKGGKGRGKTMCS